MKAIRNLFDKAKPHFEKGGKFHMFKSVFGGMETFMFVPNHTNKNGTHIRDYVDLKRTMVIVVLSLIPALLFGMYNIGYQHNLAVGETADFWQTFFYGFIRVLPIIIVSYVTGLGIEFVFAQIRDHEINEGFFVTSFLFPLILPPTTPYRFLPGALPTTSG
jgi:Na+-transporting NADH:ubiquinone oxidoreductase subunit B